jgi:hypothetical protein
MGLILAGRPHSESGKIVSGGQSLPQDLGVCPETRGPRPAEVEHGSSLTRKHSRENQAGEMVAWIELCVRQAERLAGLSLMKKNSRPVIHRELRCGAVTVLYVRDAATGKLGLWLVPANYAGNRRVNGRRQWCY